MKKVMIRNRRDKPIELSVWMPHGQPIAQMVISHGASEYSGRYDDFARFLANNNILVYGYDHIGHGVNHYKNINGIYFGKHGVRDLLNNLEDVCAYAIGNNKLPIFLFGHSMGSIIARDLLKKTRLNFDGVILTGLVNKPRFLTRIGRFIVRIGRFIQGPKGVSKFLNRMVFGKPDKIISHNKANREAYKKDKWAGEDFTNQALIDLLDLTYDASTNFDQMLDTKYLLLVGQDDRYSRNTKDLKPLFEFMKTNGYHFQKKIYPRMRHEILNEENNQEVYDDILDFIINAI